MQGKRRIRKMADVSKASIGMPTSSTGVPPACPVTPATLQLHAADAAGRLCYMGASSVPPRVPAAPPPRWPGWPGPPVAALAAADQRYQLGCYTRPWDQFDYRVALDGIAEAGFKYAGLMTAKGKSWVIITVDSTPEEVAAIARRGQAARAQDALDLRRRFPGGEVRRGRHRRAEEAHRPLRALRLSEPHAGRHGRREAGPALLQGRGRMLRLCRRRRASA